MAHVTPRSDLFGEESANTLRSHDHLLQVNIFFVLIILQLFLNQGCLETLTIPSCAKLGVRIAGDSDIKTH